MSANLFEDSIWYKQVIVDPYTVIAAFFVPATTTAHLAFIETMITTAYSNRRWPSDISMSLLEQCTFLESLINAAYLLTDKDTETKYPARFKDPPWSSQASATLQTKGELNLFPNIIPFIVYSNPYHSFQHFFRYTDLVQWKQILKALYEHCLKCNPLNEDSMPIDRLLLRFQLIQLVTAADRINASAGPK